MYVFTSESVGAGHPDKIADQISDLILDICLKKNPNSRVACEVLVTKDLVVLAGELKGVSLTHDEVDSNVRNLIKILGYDSEGFNWNTVEIQNHMHAQSEEISGCVDGGNIDLLSNNFSSSSLSSADKLNPEFGSKKSHKVGAGDQGIMFGFACDETPALMPAPIYYSHNIVKLVNSNRISGNVPGILSDNKTQVSVVYDKVDDFYKPVAVSAVVLSLNHKAHLSLKDVTDIGINYIKQVIPLHLINKDTQYFINPSGTFISGGPVADTGLTGRKITVDTYGGAAPHGGGAFSGKDCSKVDRSGAYLARYLAKNIVAAKIARKCTVQLSYAIGISEPISLFLDFHGSGNICESVVLKKLFELVDMTPSGIIDRFDLKRPIFLSTAFGGHFGHENYDQGGFDWERTDLVSILCKSL